MTCGGYGSSRLLSLTGFGSDSIVTKTLFEPPKDYFFEGCATLPSGRLIVLTWRNHKILEFSMPEFRLLREVYFPNDGWGLTYDSDRDELIATDGSDKLFYIDPSSLEITGSCNVRLSHDGSRSLPVRYMNELEYMDGLVYANIYIPAGVKGSPNFVVAINPVTCNVEQVIPISLFAGSPGNQEHVMNGIAKWPGTPDHILVSGKMWNKIFLVQVSDTYRPTNPYNITQFLSQDLFFR